ERVEQWLAEGADITQELSNAIIANDLDRVRFLVSKGADINKPDSQGWTPLQSAARQRHDDMVKLLIELGADVNLADSSGTTPLLAAVARDHVPTIKALLEHGADIEKADPEGYRPLPFAIGESRYEAAKTLMEAGANVNEPSGPDGLTPLMIAAGQSEPAEGPYLPPCRHRPDQNRKSLDGRGPGRKGKVEGRRDAFEGRGEPQQPADDRRLHRCRSRRFRQGQSRSDRGRRRQAERQSR